MSKQKNDIETEKLIRKTAKKLFFEEGKFNATTQEIADAAGVNRTLINYYFRSRDNLFDLIFEDAIKREEKLREGVLFSDRPFKEKIATYIDDTLRQAKEYPYLETYIVMKINDGSFYHDEEDWDRFKLQFAKELRAEIKKGTIDKIDPMQFMLNVASLTSFPLAVRPLLQYSMRLSDEEYDTIISKRKEIIMNLLFKK